MTRLAKTLVPAGLALAALMTLPAQAQVDGRMATVDTTGVIIGTNAFKTSFEQVNSTYSEQTELLRTKAQERQTILSKFDKNGDKQVDETENQAMQKSPDYPKLETLDQELQGLAAQIDGARIFAVEQIYGQLNAALQDVIKTQQIKMVIDPSTLIYAPAEADITQQVITVLNTKVPAVGVVPPSGWRPTRDGVQLYQEIQQRLTILSQIAQQQRAQQAAQQGNADAPIGR
jgi:Skp family chaperone for outer membrane proteins